MRLLAAVLLATVACSADQATKGTDDPYAIIAVVNQLSASPSYAIWATFPNAPARVPAILGYVNPGEMTCNETQGVPDETPPDSTIIVLLAVSEPGGADTLTSAAVVPFADPAATSPATPHRIAWFLTDTGLVTIAKPFADPFPEWPASCAR